MKRAALIFSLIFLAMLIVQTVRNPGFWRTPDQRGDWLSRHGQFSEAAKVYADPWRAGTAQYRAGDFEAAAHTFARVPGATGAFDQGNAWLMHGNYDAAIASYDRALGFRAGWKDAEENKALALARKAKIEDSGKDRDKEATEAYKPDEIKFDKKGQETSDKQQDLASQQMSDTEIRATWLRRVQTTPGDFLKAKFAYQAAHSKTQTPEGKKP